MDKHQRKAANTNTVVRLAFATNSIQNATMDSLWGKHDYRKCAGTGNALEASTATAT